MATIVRITVENDDRVETYYEPAVTPQVQEALEVLRERQWSVEVEQVDADEEIAYLRELALEEYKQAAALKGASSMWVVYLLAAKLCEQQIAAAEAAAQGRGSLLQD